LKEYSKIKRDFFYDDILEDLSMLGFYKPQLLEELTKNKDDQKKPELSQKRAAHTRNKVIANKTPAAQIIHSVSKKEGGKNNGELSERIFIVHGHDHGIRNAVALYVHKLGLTPIILADEPSGGNTLIEKLEEYQNVRYAIVLLTPDDLGRSIEETELKKRARQNVIFELGLFIGWLKRENVCPIFHSVEDLPSDYLGVGYVLYDVGGEWKLHLVRELVKAGFTIDPQHL
jgi:predicted nucleotide-binding protein